eukprot:CAMPEP_0201488150 /NCGR_PEP_ID=MMETSP0151_2-20130828/17295_1 /ASSEMBLY_ACC=CAM_ASM_000257 /TAXON_ID=200890 /ORGANISM="Paramoeba atlantica, Strain 621/1 / CCAP 1560/9" /LENGTH=171 /DNA_ID=CAMNT_0047873383 /DNA_START=56 /DNA_END=571 /DNA_ORIENTATION=-
MIHAILIINNHGKPRLSKFYDSFTEAQQQSINREIYQHVSHRSEYQCNFLEVQIEASEGIWDSEIKLIYRHYATLYFIFVVDSSESELGILDLIQVFVETLDKCFENVCELDLIFHVPKIHYILEEIVMGGLVLETNLPEIITHIDTQNSIVKQESPLSGIGELVGSLKRN